MRYKSDAEVASSSGGLLARLGIGSAEVDFSASRAIAKYDSLSSSSIPRADGNNGKLSAKLQKIRLASGETRGSAKIVEAAPLIYPEIDQVVFSGKDGEETFKDKTKDAKKFLAGYVDRRSQMEFVSFWRKLFLSLSRSGGGIWLTSTPHRPKKTLHPLCESPKASAPAPRNGPTPTTPCSTAV
jgi:hypothetical protein